MPPRPLRGYISVARVAELMGDEWPVHRMRRWLKREGALVRKGRYYYTTRARLRTAFPDVFHELFAQEF